MMLAEVQQVGAVTQRQGGPRQLAGVLLLPGEEQHTEAEGQGQAEAVPGSGLLAVAGMVSERAGLECGLSWVLVVQAHVVASVFEWAEQKVCCPWDTQSPAALPGWC